MRTYRTIALSPSTGDRALTPLPSEALTASHAALRAHLERLGYLTARSEAADLVLYVGIADGPQADPAPKALVIRVADRARGKLMWQRSAPYAPSMSPTATATAATNLMARFRKASRPPKP